MDKKKKALLSLICSVLGIALAIFLSWFHGTVIHNKGILAMSGLVGFGAGYSLVQNLIRVFNLYIRGKRFQN